MSLVIKGGNAFLGENFQKKDILLENGKIKDIGNALKGDETIEAKGMLVLPGLIDPHVHLRDPGATHKEDFTTGSRAAIAGGFTTVMDMPNNPIPTITKERLEEKKRLAKKKGICDILFHFGGTDDNLDEVRRADPHSLKLYLGHTTGHLILKKKTSLKKHFQNFPKDRQIVLHACDHSLDEPENLRKTYETVQDAISLASGLGRKIHLAHASAKKIPLRGVESRFEGDIDLRGFLGISPDVPVGYKEIRVYFKIDADISDEQKEELLRLGEKYSPVTNTIKSQTPVAVHLDKA